MSLDIFLASTLVLFNGTLVLALALVLTSLFRGFSASFRHLMLFGALISMVLLIPAAVLLPSWSIPALPALTPISMPSADAGRSVGDSLGESGAPALSHEDAGALGAGMESARSGEPAGDGGMMSHLAAFGSAALPWVALAVWIAGAAAILIVQLVRWAGAGFIASMAASVDDDGWKKPAERIGAEQGLVKPVTLCRSEMTAATMTWGIKRPCIVLPSDSREWSTERIEAVLRHELAHVKRNDNLTHLLAVAVSALFWFNPLVWIVMRRLNYEREAACDDQVLRGGVFATTYARHLMDLSRRLTGPKSEKIIPAVMAHSSNLKKRILSILDAKVNRRALRPVVATVSLLGVLALALPVAAFQPWRVAVDDDGFTFTGRVHLGDPSQYNIFYIDGKDCAFYPQNPLDFKLITPEAFLILNKHDEDPAIRFEVRVGPGGEYVVSYYLDDEKQVYDERAEERFHSLLRKFVSKGRRDAASLGEDYQTWYERWQAGELDYMEAYNSWLQSVDTGLILQEAYLMWREARSEEALLRKGDYEKWLASVDKDKALAQAFTRWMEKASAPRHDQMPAGQDEITREESQRGDNDLLTLGDVVDLLTGGRGDVTLDVKHVVIDIDTDWLYRFSEPYGYLIITRVVNDEVHRYEIRSRPSGEMTRKYIVDGKELPFDDAVEGQFRRLLRSMFLESEADEPSIPDDP